MHRFVSPKIDGVGATVTLSREESEHATRVLRLKPGEKVQLLDGENLYDATLTLVNEHEVTAQAVACCLSPEAPAWAALWQGLPKADKLEWIVQKATELGAQEIWPVEMSRSIAKGGGKDEKKAERYRRIALEAAKQSGRARVPDVSSVRSFQSALNALEAFDLTLVAWEEEHALPLSQAVGDYCKRHGKPTRVLIVIGPEGGISEEEKALLASKGAVSVTLGRRILRTETAGLCALSVLWTALGEM
ncbi:MAG: RsmE family RNA methyltransferase [Eubacteriales bacterium]|nr:RsmE family RNA methyltransferase [Eubacteriales bacterium]